MLDTTHQLEMAVWSVADGRATAAQLAVFEADTRATLRVLERLIDETEENLDSVNGLQGLEREQVVADPPLNVSPRPGQPLRG